MIKELFELPKKKYGMYNDLEIADYLYHENLAKVVIVGSGDILIWCVDWLKSLYDIIPDTIVFSKEDDSCLLDGVMFDDWKPKAENIYVIVADDNMEDPQYKVHMIDEIKNRGAKTIYNVSNVAKPYWPAWYAFIKRNVDQFEEIAPLLQDDISRELLVEYLKVYITGTRFEGRVESERNKYWGIESDGNNLFQLNEEDVILNLGGCTGDTIFQYLKNHLPFKKFISVECESKSYQYILRSVDYLIEPIKSKIQVDNYFISEGNYTLDNLYLNEGISLIEMDIEGAELSALQTGVKLLKRNRPILAICAYHRVDDLIEIPKFVKETLEDYVFILRKYPSCYYPTLQNIQQVNELVLYAIPKERYLK